MTNTEYLLSLLLSVAIGTSIVVVVRLNEIIALLEAAP